MESNATLHIVIEPSILAKVMRFISIKTNSHVKLGRFIPVGIKNRLLVSKRWARCSDGNRTWFLPIDTPTVVFITLWADSQKVKWNGEGKYSQVMTIPIDFHHPAQIPGVTCDRELKMAMDVWLPKLKHKEQFQKVSDMFEAVDEFCLSFQR